VRRIQRHGDRHIEVHWCVEINMAQAFKMPHHRHPCVILDPLDQALTTSGNNHVDELGHVP
jgi:hypothetical protein